MSPLDSTDIHLGASPHFKKAKLGEHRYVYLDGIALKRSWGGEVKNVSVLVAFGVNQEGYRKILGVTIVGPGLHI